MVECMSRVIESSGHRKIGSLLIELSSRWRASKPFLRRLQTHFSDSTRNIQPIPAENVATRKTRSHQLSIFNLQFTIYHHFLISPVSMLQKRRSSSSTGISICSENILKRRSIKRYCFWESDFGRERVTP